MEINETLFKLGKLKKEQLAKVAKLVDKLYLKNEANGEVFETKTVPAPRPHKQKVESRVEPADLHDDDDDADENGEILSVPEKMRRDKKLKKTVNRFDQMQERRLHKDDVATDKKLWGNNTPTPRRDTLELVNTNCHSCGKTFSVSPAMLYNDGEQVKYTCNNCSVKRKR